MTVIKFAAFIGEIPRIIPRLLPNEAATEAINTRIEDGSLFPINKSRTDFSSPLLPAVKPATIYYHQNAWLYWPSRVNASPGPIAQDRLYYTGDNMPRVRINGVVYRMKIDAPSIGLTATLVGAGSGSTVDTRYYAYTNVSQFAEESEPSPLSNPVDWLPGQTVTLSGFSNSMGDRTAELQRIYRSQSSSGGATELFLIAERYASTDDYSDAGSPAAIGTPLPSLEYDKPEDTLHSLTSMPNGFFAAADGKEIHFSEPYIPHAWPIKYRLTVDSTVVGLGAFGTTLVVMTDSNPYIITGSHPDSMVMEKLELNLPCINAAGIVDMGYAIAYPSYDGLVVASASGARVATETIMTRNDWLEINPYTIVSTQHDGRYAAFYSYTDIFNNEQEGLLLIDLSSEQRYLFRSTAAGIAAYYREDSGALYYLQNKAIKEWDALGELRETLGWVSKEQILPKPANLGAIYIDAQGSFTAEELAAMQAGRAAIIAANNAVYADMLGGEINSAAINEYGVNGDALEDVPDLDAIKCTVIVYADDVAVASISKLNRAMRLPSGYLARKYQIEVSSNIRVNDILLATTGAELGAA